MLIVKDAIKLKNGATDITLYQKKQGVLYPPPIVQMVLLNAVKLVGKYIK
jgi:hypothetical protein